MGGALEINVKKTERKNMLKILEAVENPALYIHIRFYLADETHQKTPHAMTTLSVAERISYVLYDLEGKVRVPLDLLARWCLCSIEEIKNEAQSIRTKKHKKWEIKKKGGHAVLQNIRK